MNRSRTRLQVFLNQHVENMNSMFKSLYKDEKLADVTLYCRDGSIKAHKLILAACSPYFQEIFLHNKTDNFTMFMHGVTLEELESLIDLIYKGTTDIYHDNLDRIYDIAEDLKINGLSQGRTKVPGRNNVDARQSHSRESRYVGTYRSKRNQIQRSGRNSRQTFSQNTDINNEDCTGNTNQEHLQVDISHSVVDEETLTVTREYEQEYSYLGRTTGKVYKFKCKVCPRYFKTLRQFKRHEMSHVEQNIQDSIDTEDFDFHNNLDTCNAIVEPSETLLAEDNENAQLTNESFIEPGATVSPLARQRRHIKYKCKICSSSFQSLPELKAHERKHVTPNLYNTLGTDNAYDDDDFQVTNETLMDTSYEVIVDDRGSPLFKNPTGRPLQRQPMQKLQPRITKKRKVGRPKEYPKAVPLEIFEAHWNSTFNSLENGRSAEPTLEVENSLRLQASVTTQSNPNGEIQNIALKQMQKAKEKTIAKLPRINNKQDLGMKFANPVVVLTNFDSSSNSISGTPITSAGNVETSITSDKNAVSIQSKRSVTVKCRKRKSFSKLTIAGQKLRRLRASRLFNKVVENTDINSANLETDAQYENPPLLLPEVKPELVRIQTSTEGGQEVMIDEAGKRPVRRRKNRTESNQIIEIPTAETVLKRRGRKSNPDKEATKDVVSGRITKRGRKPNKTSGPKLAPISSSDKAPKTRSRRGRKSGYKRNQNVNTKLIVQQDISTSWLESSYTQMTSYHNTHTYTGNSGTTDVKCVPPNDNLESDTIQSIINRTVQKNLIHLPQHQETIESQRTNQLVLLKTEYLQPDGDNSNTDGNIVTEDGPQQIYLGSLTDLKAEFLEQCNDGFILQTSGTVSPSGSMYLQVLAPTEGIADNTATESIPTNQSAEVTNCTQQQLTESENAVTEQ